MKIRIKSKEGRNFRIYLPMSLARFGVRVGMWGVKRSHHIDEETRKYLDIIDEKVIIRALKDLSETYKGLDLVDIQTKDGEVIKITV
ncbi:hypothetical protein [Clostridium sp.]|uniref:hypothetical protein n=1 Tax=Clostridium sp. TaxID=1506 RepID=UPI002FC86455